MDLHWIYIDFAWILYGFTWMHMDSYGFILINIDLNGLKFILHRFMLTFYGFMLTYMHSNMFICVFDVFMSLVWPASVPQALFFRQKRYSRILGLCQFWKLSEL